MYYSDKLARIILGLGYAEALLRFALGVTAIIVATGNLAAVKILASLGIIELGLSIAEFYLGVTASDEDLQLHI